MLEIKITPAPGERVSVTLIGQREEIEAFALALDTGAKYQRVPISPTSELELARLLDVIPIEFFDDGRWRLGLTTVEADVVARRSSALARAVDLRIS